MGKHALFGAGQSNIQRTLVDVGLFGANGYGEYYFNGELFDINNGGPKQSILTYALLSNQERGVEDFYTIGVKAVGGSFATDNGVPSENWSSNGTIRQQAIDDLNDMLSLMQATDTVDSVTIVWNQGLADSGRINLAEITELDYQNALEDIFADFRAQSIVPIDRILINETGSQGTDTNPTSDAGKVSVRNAQTTIANNDSRIELFFTGSKYFIERDGYMADNDHYSLEIGDKAVGDELSRFLNSRDANLRDTIFTEWIDVKTDRLYSYYKGNGDGVNEVTNGTADLVFENGFNATNTSTLLNTYPHLMLETTTLNSIARGAETPFITQGYNTFALSMWVYLPAGFDQSKDHRLWSDVNATDTAGFQINAKTVFQLQMYNSGGSQLFSSDVAVSTVLDDWTHLAVTYDGKDFKFYINSTLKGTITRDAGIPEVGSNFALNRKPYSAQSTDSELINFGQVYAWVGFSQDSDDFTQDDVDALFSGVSQYNIDNTPVTPSVPVITDQDDVNNIFAYTPTTGVEMRIDTGSGFGAWFDQNSPYSVGNIDIAIGGIEIRVKTEGVNPASDTTASTQSYNSTNLIIQTDDGLTSNSNTYVDVAELESYWTIRNIDLSTYTKAQKEAALVKGWQYVDSRHDYCGKRLNGRTQTTEFPRENLYDSECNAIEGVPYEIKEAQMEYALREVQGTILQGDQSSQGNIKRIRKKIDVIETETEYSPSLSGSTVKEYPTADNKIPSYFICNTGDYWMGA